MSLDEQLKKIKELIGGAGEELGDLYYSESEAAREEARAKMRMAQIENDIRMKELELQNRISQQSAVLASMGASGSGGQGLNAISNQGISSGGGGYVHWGQSVNITNSTEEKPMEDKQNIRIRDLDVTHAPRVLMKVLKTNIVPFLWGPPGVGKSSLVRQICKENNWDLVDLRLSLLNPVDLRGLPVLDKENNVANWYPPAFLPKKNHKKVGVLFLDEINLAPLSVQAAAYQLILDKKVGEYEFPSHWKIIAAGNRETDKANVYRISAPLANRFIHYTVGTSVETWREWARETNIRPEIIRYLSLKRASLLQMPRSHEEKAFPSPRSWEFVSQLLDAFEYDEDQKIDDDLKQTIAGAIGEATGKEFIAFLGSFRMKDTLRQIEDFIQTGRLEMPKNPNARYAFVYAVYDTYRSGKMGEDRYRQFCEKLTGEEKAGLKSFEEKHQEKIKKKYGV